MKRQRDPREQWPQKRDYFERPARFRYVRKKIRVKGCVFCDALKRGVKFQSLCVATTEHSLVVLNKFPYNTGHLLILPKRHVPSLLDLDAEEYRDLTDTVLLSLQVIEGVYQCEGLNLGMNLGKAAGAGIPGHLHWHIVPRWYGDTNFFPLIATTKVIPEKLSQSYKKLRRGFLAAQRR